MAFIVENGTGLQDATAYIDVAFCRELNTVEGNDLSTHNDAAVELLIQRATRFMDTFWRFEGYRSNTLQSLEFPRVNLYYRDGRIALGVPIEVKEACALYAARAATAPLAPDPVYDDSGARVVSKRQKVGPIEEELAFAADGALTGKRRYPAADMRIRDFVITGRFLERV